MQVLLNTALSKYGNLSVLPQTVPAKAMKLSLHTS